MSYPCEVKQTADQPVMSIRTRTVLSALPQKLGEGYGRVMQYLTAQGAHPSGAPFVAYYNQDMEDLDIEVGFPVAVDLPGQEDVKPNVIPGGKTATCFYTGPYNQIEQAYTEFLAWTGQQGLELTEHMYEFYLNDPAETAPENLQTLIVWPVKE